MSGGLKKRFEYCVSVFLYPIVKNTMGASSAVRRCITTDRCKEAFNFLEERITTPIDINARKGIVTGWLTDTLWQDDRGYLKERGIPTKAELYRVVAKYVKKNYHHMVDAVSSIYTADADDEGGFNNWLPASISDSSFSGVLSLLGMLPKGAPNTVDVRTLDR